MRARARVPVPRRALERVARPVRPFPLRVSSYVVLISRTRRDTKLKMHVRDSCSVRAANETEAISHSVKSEHRMSKTPDRIRSRWSVVGGTRREMGKKRASLVTWSCIISISSSVSVARADDVFPSSSIHTTRLPKRMISPPLFSVSAR